MSIQGKSMKSYAAPTLSVHGKVAELTASGGTGAAENTAARKPGPGEGMN